MTHRARSLLVRQRTMTANALRAHLAELGFVANPGIANLAKLAEQALADKDVLPSYARTALEMLVRQIMGVSGEIEVQIETIGNHTAIESEFAEAHTFGAAHSCGSIDIHYAIGSTGPSSPLRTKSGGGEIVFKNNSLCKNGTRE